ncbi:hypothetical protein H920_03396 [Fukomys damarensis]|uniref:Uncharacterized protein n=1 Tax=Fukomys damarensis TaxID=885580 RepID=A0A091EIH1_FUKDA|nr:hypothetical protein H920_03396 [Fukomys damarensis]
MPRARRGGIPASSALPGSLPGPRGAGSRALEETPPPRLGCNEPQLKKLTLGITRILESSPCVTGNHHRKGPAERHMISSWEQKHNCMMLEDVKRFFWMTIGFYTER